MEKEMLTVEEILGIDRPEDMPLYTEKLLYYGNNTDAVGIMEAPDAYGRVEGFCGDSNEMFLEIKNGVIEAVRFTTSGCFFSRAACNAAALMAKGKTVLQALAINEGMILAELEGMPEDHEHCAYLAALTLQWAIEQWQKNNGVEELGLGDVRKND